MDHAWLQVQQDCTRDVMFIISLYTHTEADITSCMHSDTQLDMVTVVNFSQADVYCHYVIHVCWYTTQGVLYSECPLSEVSLYMYMYIYMYMQVYKYIHCT